MRMPRHAPFIVLVFGTLFSFQPALAQFSQQGSKLVGSGAVGNAKQGRSVSVSADGNTAIVGGWEDDSLAGAAWVWTRNAGVWTQQGPKLVGTGAVGKAWQGQSVSLSADGNTAIVGGSDDHSGIGAAWIWTRNAGVWTQQGTKLVGSGSPGVASQGWSVSLSADGNTAIVGGISDDSNTGAAWVWTRNAGAWTQQGPKLVGSDAVGIGLQGWSVSLSADGNTAIVGGPPDDATAGAAWVWTRSAGVWTQQGPKLVGSGAVGAALQGSSVSLSADGNTAIVGGTDDDGYAGATWVWTRSAGVWTQQGPKLVGSGAVDPAYQGTSVSLSADGNTAVVGGLYDNNKVGAAWVWTRSGGLWAQQGSKLVGSGAEGAAFQGYSVSLSSDGSTIVVGGFIDDYDTGAAWVFNAALGPVALGTDRHVGGGSTGNGNGVIEPGESVIVDTTWKNLTTGSLAATGAASSFLGPAGATYSIVDSSAGFGTLAAGSEADCFSATGNCYGLSVSAPPTRPVAHWDSTFSETINGASLKAWTLHIGGSFTDVPETHWAYRFVETIFHNGITSGCGTTTYCPDTSLSRAEMAVLLEVARHGPSWTPAPSTGGVFTDVPVDHWAGDFIEALAAEGITSGCGVGLYCPDSPVTRAEMAVLLLAAEHGSEWTPPLSTGLVFTDVPIDHWAGDFIEVLAAEGITDGCGVDLYCPESPVTRAEMAVFLTATFNLKL